MVDNVLGSIDPRTMQASDVSVNATAIRVATKIIDADIFDEEQVRVTTSEKALSVSTFLRYFLHEF